MCCLTLHETIEESLNDWHGHFGHYSSLNHYVHKQKLLHTVPDLCVTESFLVLSFISGNLKPKPRALWMCGCYLIKPEPLASSIWRFVCSRNPLFHVKSSNINGWALECISSSSSSMFAEAEHQTSDVGSIGLSSTAMFTSKPLLSRIQTSLIK